MLRTLITNFPYFHTFFLNRTNVYSCIYAEVDKMYIIYKVSLTRLDVIYQVWYTVICIGQLQPYPKPTDNATHHKPKSKNQKLNRTYSSRICHSRTWSRWSIQLESLHPTCSCSAPTPWRIASRYVCVHNSRSTQCHITSVAISG